MQTQDVIRWIRDELSREYGVGEARAMTRLVMEELVPEVPWTKLQWSDEDVKAEHQNQVRAWLAEIKEGKPLQYVLGSAWFDGLKLEVNRDVLIPRPETEELVGWVDEWLRARKETAAQWRILDLGTGSGCIALSLKNRMPDKTVFGLEKSPSALEVAKRNANRLGLSIEWVEANILDEQSVADIPESEVWVSNPPYVLDREESEMDFKVTHHEPHMALFVPADDPVLFYHSILNLADKHPQRPIAVFFEIHPVYADEVTKVCREHHWSDVILLRDISGRNRMIGAFR